MKHNADPDFSFSDLADLFVSSEYSGDYKNMAVPRRMRGTQITKHQVTGNRDNFIAK